MNSRRWGTPLSAPADRLRYDLSSRNTATRNGSGLATMASRGIPVVKLVSPPININRINSRATRRLLAAEVLRGKLDVALAAAHAGVEVMHVLVGHEQTVHLDDADVQLRGAVATEPQLVRRGQVTHRDLRTPDAQLRLEQVVHIRRGAGRQAEGIEPLAISRQPVHGMNFPGKRSALDFDLDGVGRVDGRLRNGREDTDSRGCAAGVRCLGVAVVAHLRVVDAAGCGEAIIQGAGIAVVAADLQRRVAGPGERVAHVERTRIAVRAVRVLLAGARLVVEIARAGRSGVPPRGVTVVPGPDFSVVADLVGEGAAGCRVAGVDGARIAVVAGRGGEVAPHGPVAQVVRARVVVVARDRRSGASATETGVARGARAAVVAGHHVDAMHAAHVWNAGVVGAHVAVVAGDGGSGAGAGHAGVARGAHVAVVASSRRRQVGAVAPGGAEVGGAGVAVVAGIRREDAALGRVAGVGGAKVTVVAGRVGREDTTLGRVAGISGAGAVVVALRGRGAAADADEVAHLASRAGVAVVAGRDDGDVDARVGDVLVGRAGVAVVARVGVSRARIGVVVDGAGVDRTAIDVGRDGRSAFATDRKGEETEHRRAARGQLDELGSHLDVSSKRNPFPQVSEVANRRRLSRTSHSTLPRVVRESLRSRTETPTQREGCLRGEFRIYLDIC